MSKRELIECICEINKSAKPEFLAHFSEEDLRIALDKVRQQHLLLGVRTFLDENNDVWFTTENVPKNQLVWDIRLLERHGIKKYPFGPNNLIDLECDARKDHFDEVQVNAKSTTPITLILEWIGGKKEITI